MLVLDIRALLMPLAAFLLILVILPILPAVVAIGFLIIVIGVGANARSNRKIAHIEDSREELKRGKTPLLIKKGAARRYITAQIIAGPISVIASQMVYMVIFSVFPNDLMFAQLAYLLAMVAQVSVLLAPMQIFAKIDIKVLAPIGGFLVALPYLASGMFFPVSDIFGASAMQAAQIAAAGILFGIAFFFFTRDQIGSDTALAASAGLAVGWLGAPAITMTLYGLGTGAMEGGPGLVGALATALSASLIMALPAFALLQAREPSKGGL